MDPSEVGRFGTLRFMKRNEPNTAAAVFPIDDEEVTFGRDPDCSVRLYYDSVSAVHAKIIFQERKAFLVVLGTNGLLIDNTHVFPSTSTTSPTTIPLSNHSEIEIHKKRFVFMYPPKELRPLLLATPSRSELEGGKRRALRMSMIQSAQVFSPRPSNDPRVNLRILQSPLKPFGRTPRRPSPLKHGNMPHHKEEDEHEEEIILVDGNYPRVTEEDKDLVILEDVEVDIKPQPEPEPQWQLPSTPGRLYQARQNTTPNFPRPVFFPPPQHQLPSPTPSLSSPTPQHGPAMPLPNHTPRPTRPPRPSLHRAVLLRSAQRAAMKIEMEVETEEEEREVEEVVAGIDEETEDDEDEDEGDENEKDMEDMEEVSIPTTPTSGWRKSLEAVKGFGWPFRSPSPQVTVEHDEEQKNIEENTTEVTESEHIAIHEKRDEQGKQQEQHDNDHDMSEHPSTPPHATPVPAQPRAPMLGQFMTPQAQRPAAGTYAAAPQSVRPGVAKGRGGLPWYSKGTAGPADGPKRIKVDQPWKVRDIEVPVTEVKEESEHGDMAVVGDLWRKAKVDEEERKAILERRRSALTMPDAFFGNQIPGSRRGSMVPQSPAQGSSSAFLSPTKTDHNKDLLTREGEDVDSKVLLERMKETVEDMKRRRSIRFSLGLTPSPVKKSMKGRFSLLAPGAMPVMMNLQEEEEDNNREADKDAAKRTNYENDGSVGKRNEDDDEMGIVQEDGNDEQMVVDEFDGDGVRDAMSGSNRDATTPRMDDLKHVFSRKPATPKMDGVRDMFLRERPRETGSPAFEGIGEMLSTPVGYRHQTEADSHEGSDNADEVTMTKGTRGKKTLATKSKPVAADATVTRRRTPRTATVNGTTNDTPNMGDDELTPHTEKSAADELGDTAGGSHSRSRAPRKRQTESDTDTAPVVKVRKPRVLRGRRAADTDSKNTQSSDRAGEIVQTEAMRENPKSAEISSADSPVNASDGNGTEQLTSAPVETENPQDKHPTIRSTRTRVTRTKAQTANVLDGERPQISGSGTDHEATARPPASKSRSRGTRVKPIDVDDDPLDFIERPDSPDTAIAGSSKTSTQAGRNRTPTPTIKEEEEGTTIVKATATKSKKTPSTRTRTGTKAGATRTDTPTITDGSADSEATGDKENTRDLSESPADAVDDPPAPAKKSRGTRKTRAVKEEDVTEMPKTTRVTRARARKV